MYVIGNMPPDIVLLSYCVKVWPWIGLMMSYYDVSIYLCIYVVGTYHILLFFILTPPIWLLWDIE